MKLKTALLVAIIAIFLGLILVKNKSVLFKFQAQKHQITNVDIYKCTRMALDKRHGELLGVKTISSKDKKYLRISIKDQSKKLELDCDLATHDLINEQHQ
jgi:outer membrane lipoprotein-sorting protein